MDILYAAQGVDSPGVSVSVQVLCLPGVCVLVRWVSV